MVAINNFAGLGAKKTFGKIVFSRSVGKGLRIIIAESGPHQSENQNEPGFNPCIQYEAGVTRDIHVSGNGISYFYDAYAFCTNSTNHIKQVELWNNPPFSYLTPPTFKENFKSEEITGDGFKVYTTKQDVRLVDGGEMWQEVWKVSFDNFKEFIRKL